MLLILIEFSHKNLRVRLSVSQRKLVSCSVLGVVDGAGSLVDLEGVVEVPDVAAPEADEAREPQEPGQLGHEHDKAHHGQRLLNQSEDEGDCAEASLLPVGGERSSHAGGQRVAVEEDGEHGFRGGDDVVGVAHLWRF